VLCNNAGRHDRGVAATELGLSAWNDVLATNLTAPFLMARAVIPAMISAEGGAIVNVASVSSFVTGGGGVAYTASKHGVLGLTRALAHDYGVYGIRVNCVCPGATLTEMVSDPDDPRMRRFVSKLPIPRWGHADDVARTVAFLASDDATYVTGAAWTVDGGWTLGHLRPGG
jgi:NAD(P)-dependent dehydrogenase (short-subunit alcohol dehydrogenase family)